MEEAEAGAFWRIYWPGRVGFTVRAGTPGATASLLLLGARLSSPTLQSFSPTRPMHMLPCADGRRP